LEQAAFLWDASDRVEGIFDAAENAVPDADPVIVHGDLNLRHPLVFKSGALAGVIDWGDMCQASPAIDLPLYWSLFDRDGRAAFRAAYGPLTDAMLTQARVLALFMDATLAVYADENGMVGLKREALQGLRRTVTS
jgi:aminoglycoside phosphotransferase (APT) family kinase protein